MNCCLAGSSRSHADPFESKKQLALEIVKTYHSEDVAQKTLADWNARFSEKRLEDADLPLFAAKSDQIVALVVEILFAGVFQPEVARRGKPVDQTRQCPTRRTEDHRSEDQRRVEIWTDSAPG